MTSPPAPSRQSQGTRAPPSLGSVAVPHASWFAGLAQVYLRLIHTPPDGCHTFPRVLGFAASQRSEWSANAGPSQTWRSLDTRGQTTQYPLATALLAIPPHRDAPVLDTLVWLALELHLAGWGEADIAPLCSWIRGIASRTDHPLRDAIGSCNGLIALDAGVRSLGTKAPTKHQGFDEAWNDWLRDLVARLLGQAVAASEAEDPWTVPLDGQTADSPDPTQDDPSEPDIGSGWILEPVENAGAGHGLKTRLASAVGRELHRRTSPDLLRDPDNILPASIARESWQSAANVADSLLKSGDVGGAGLAIEHLLAIEVGLSHTEASVAAFGAGPAMFGPVIDLDVGALRRPESRPTRAYSPPAGASAYWHPTGGDILFPLSQPLVDRCRTLLAQRSGKRPLDARLRWTDCPQKPERVTSTGEIQPHTLLGILEPTRSATRATYRRRIAATLAERLGPDAAQIAFGDTFGASAAPTYYGAYSAKALAAEAAAANVGLSYPLPGASVVSAPAGNGLLSPPLQSACGHTLGSRVRPIASTFTDLWAAVGVVTERKRGRPKSVRDVGEWQKLRDSLAIHLMIATGHRPVSAMGEITLTDFIPSKALVLIHDKRSDPSRLNRLVCTGWKFFGALEAYIEELRRICDDPCVDARWCSHARAIMRGSVPLLSLPGNNGGSGALQIRELLLRLPAPWQERPNLHRHALNQALIEARVDPELRYFQLGWHEGDVHATSSVAPYPATRLGEELAGTIDRWLESVGWQGGAEPKDPDRILAAVPLQDFQRAEHESRKECERRVHELRHALNERRREVGPEVTKVLINGLNALPVAKSIEACLSSGSHGALVLRLRPGASRGLKITREMVKSVLAPLRAPGREAIHEYVGARILSTALHQACRHQVCRADLPPLHHPNYKAVPSPFVDGIGLAVSLANELRNALVKVASAHAGLPDWRQWRAQLCIWAILAYTPYRSLEQARMIVRALGEAVHSEAQGWIIRIPYGAGHVLMTGCAAILLHRLRSDSGWKDSVDAVFDNDPNSLGAFIRTCMPSRIPQSVGNPELLQWMVATLRVAGAVELTGAERMVMTGVVEPATVTADRAAAADDGVTVHVATAGGDAHAGTAAHKSRSSGDNSATTVVADRTLRGVMRYFHRDYAGDIAGVVAEPAAGRIRQLRPVVAALLQSTAPRPTPARALLEYVHHLMVVGGPKSPGGMALGSIHTTYYRIAPLVRFIPPTSDLGDMDEEQLTCALLSALALSASRNRHAALDAVRLFWKFLQTEHGAVQPDWDLLYTHAGVAVKGKDPAIVTDAEVEDVLDVLRKNQTPDALVGVDPLERRMRELQFASALLLEASGVRPQSVYALTLADVHLHVDGDFLHLRSSGRYAEMKTSTSAGYVPLGGEVWQKYRPWFVKWFEGLRGAAARDTWAKIPLFQNPRENDGVRVARPVVLDRLGALLSWRLQTDRARPYWFRKRCVQRRHIDARSRIGATARSVYRAMRACGHATISTPIASYIGDPAGWMDVGSRVLAAIDRRTAAALSGLSLGTVDQRWFRWRSTNGANGAVDSPDPAMRLARVLHMRPSQWSLQALPDPPAHRPLVAGMSWEAVGNVMAALAVGHAVDRVARTTHVHINDVQEIAGRCEGLSALTKRVFGKAPLRRPRDTQLYARLYERVATAPARYQVIADDWVACSSHSLANRPIALIAPGAVDAMRTLLREVGLDLSTMHANPPVVLCDIVKGGRTVYGARRALLWLLAVLWVARGLGTPAR